MGLWCMLFWVLRLCLVFVRLIMCEAIVYYLCWMVFHCMITILSLLLLCNIWVVSFICLIVNNAARHLILLCKFL